MKKMILALLGLAFLLCFCSTETEQPTVAGVFFEQGKLADALAKAVKLNKPVMVDFYSDG